MLSHELVIDGIAYIRSRDAARAVSLTPDYITSLARGASHRRIRVEGLWYVSLASLHKFVAEQERQKEIWRAHLAKQRREEQRPRRSSVGACRLTYAAPRTQRSFQNYICARATHASLVSTSLLVVCLLIGRASHLKYLRRRNRSRAQSSPSDHFPSRPLYVCDSHRSATSPSQRKAATRRRIVLPWLDAFAGRLYRAICPYFSDCEMLATNSATSPQNVNPPLPSKTNSQQATNSDKCQVSTHNSPPPRRHRTARLRLRPQSQMVLRPPQTKHSLPQATPSSNASANVRTIESRHQRRLRRRPHRGAPSVASAAHDRDGKRKRNIVPQRVRNRLAGAQAVVAPVVRSMRRQSPARSRTRSTARSAPSSTSRRTRWLPQCTFTNATTTNLDVSGTATIGSGTGVLQTTTGVVSTIANGSNGQVLKIVGGSPTW